MKHFRSSQNVNTDRRQQRNDGNKADTKSQTERQF